MAHSCYSAEAVEVDTLSQNSTLLCFTQRDADGELQVVIISTATGRRLDSSRWELHPVCAQLLPQTHSSDPVRTSPTPMPTGSGGKGACPDTTPNSNSCLYHVCTVFCLLRQSRRDDGTGPMVDQ